MFKKLVVIIVALIISISSSMAVFAGNPEGSGISGSSANNSTAKDASQKTDAGKAEVNDSTVQTLKSDAAATDSAAAGDKEKTEDPQAEIKAAIKEVLKSGSVEDNGQFLMTINNPKDLNKIEEQYNNIYNVTGRTEYNDLIILLAKFNKSSGEYEIVELPDGDKSIPVSSGCFSVELNLELGENNMLLISYRASEKSPKMIQYNVFTIIHRKETISQKILRTTVEVGEAVYDFFTGKSK